jgi:hypothetical protein
MCLTRAEVHWFSPSSRWCSSPACSTSNAGALLWPLGPSSSISFHPLGYSPPFITPTFSAPNFASIVFFFFSFFFLLKKHSLEKTLTPLGSWLLTFLYENTQRFTRVMHPFTKVICFFLDYGPDPFAMETR